jgi:uncharacterized heparinase superfamily protein
MCAAESVMSDPSGHGMALRAADGLSGEPEPGKVVTARPHGLIEGLRNAYYASAVYPLTLTGPAPTGLAVTPEDPWPGDPVLADALFQGRYRFAGHEVTAPSRPIWLPLGASEAWIEEMHGFEWLRNLKANGGEAARRQARGLIMDWCREFGAWRPIVWRADILGRRLAAWLVNASFLLRGAEQDFTGGYYDSLARQARHLTRAAGREVVGGRRLSAIRGLLFAALCLDWGERRRVQLLRLLVHEIAAQVLSDGGHIERSPSVLRRALGDLAELRGLLVAAKQTPPEELIQALDRLAPMLRALRHGDGGLACFNDSFEDDPALIDVTLTIADARGKALANAPHAGFQRLQARRTLVLVDAGPPSALAEHVQAGTLSFEMSVAKERLIVNCGPHWGRGPEWATALRSTGAHSTLTVDDTNSTEFVHRGLGRRPRTVTCTRMEQDGTIWIDLGHDGYAANFGLIHRRRLYLNADGDDLRGEDSLEGAPDSKTRDRWPQPFAVRFHLHPSVQASLVRNGQAVLMRLPSGIGWQFRASGGSIAVHPSIYFGADGERRRSEQVVVSGMAPPDGAQVKWALRRVSRR